MKKLILFFHLTIFYSAISVAQIDQTNELIRVKEAEIETESFQENNSQEDYQLFDAIEHYTQSPINLNTATENDLNQFPFFNAQLTRELVQHRELYGNLISIEELQLLDGVDAEKIRNMKPFLTLGQTANQRKIKLKTLLNEGANSIMIRFQPNTNPTNEESANGGSPHKIYMRYKYQYADRIRFGLTGEKDGGEKFFKDENKNGFDFYSGHLIIKSKSFIRQITLGDYTIQNGQGLVLWSGMGFGKSTEVLNIQKQSTGVKPYTSVDENNYLRGAAISTFHKNWTTDLFFSSHKRDGNLIGEEEDDSFSSFQTSGYHRTISELQDRKSVLETNFGVSLKKTLGKINFGGIVYYTEFSKALVKESTINNRYELRGKENINYGINISYLYKNIQSFSEFSMSKNGGTAMLLGSIIHLHPKLSYAVLFRNYEKNYQASQAKGFSENSKTSNEQGVFSSIQLKIPSNLTLSAYADYFFFPWSKFGVDGPSSGNEYLLQLKWKPKRSFESYLQLKIKTKEENGLTDGVLFNQITSNRKTSIRWNIRIKLNETWDWGNRIEKSFFQTQNGNCNSGIMVYQDILFHPLNFPISIGIRYALFDTDNYETRIYAYENDVLFSYSIPAMQGRGEKMYINIRYRISKMLDLWLRYSVTNYEKDIQSSTEEINNNLAKKDLKVQLRLQF